jgi:Flp pilus assembly protein CpaB
VIVLLVVGVGLGALTAVSVYVTTTQAAAQRAAQASAPVVVPVHAIAARAVLQAGDVQVQQERRGDVPAQAASRLDQVLGQVALVNFYAGAPILLPQVASAKTASSLGATLPKGLEAMALPTPDLVSGVGAIVPGDRIDIILTVPPQGANAQAKETQFALQAIEVIGVGQVMTTQQPNANANQVGVAPQTTTQGSLTVLVTPQQALILTYAKDSATEGVSINLVLRRPDDTGASHTDAVTLGYLRQALDKVQQ